MFNRNFETLKVKVQPSYSNKVDDKNVYWGVVENEINGNKWK